MRSITAFLLTLMIFLIGGCSRYQNEDGSTASKPVVPSSNSEVARSETSVNYSLERTTEQQATMQTVSLNDADKSQTATIAMERKIIRNAEMSIEVSSPMESLRRIASAAEARGGFVVTSDATQREGNDQTRPELTIKVVVRIPAAQFDATVEEIRGVASRIKQEKMTGQDVTEEFIDLEARIRSKQALEAQFLEIMKQARSISDALQVQTQLSEVRTEIERLEGRRRFLVNQSSLSTITVTLQSPTALVSTTGFFFSVKQAFADGLDVAAGMTLFLIRAIVTLLPIAVFVFLPLGLLARFLIRRMRRFQLAQELTRDEPLGEAKSK